LTVPLRVLIVEDSQDDTALLVRELRRGGYEPTFERIDTPTAMSAAVDSRQWDLVICDYSMPQFSGIDALRLLRDKGSEAPFIFLSGTIGEETAIAALKQGAQDYVMKDNLKRLLPAIQRELGEAEQRRERKRLEHQVQELQKFEAIGRLAGGIAHDFNNALGVIIGWAQLGYDDVPANSPLRENFERIRDQAQHSAGLTRQLLAFARRQVLQPRSLNLNGLVSETTGLLNTAIGEQTELKLALAPDLQMTMADPTQIEQVLMNLCLNACRRADASSSRPKTSRSEKTFVGLIPVASPADMSCSPFPTQAWEWMRQPLTASSSHFSLQRKWAEEPGWDWQPCTAL